MFFPVNHYADDHQPLITGRLPLNAYTMDTAQADQYFDLAYADVSQAFDRYLKDYNNGRPFILAGFSQGSEMLLRLLEDSDPVLVKSVN